MGVRGGESLEHPTRGPPAVPGGNGASETLGPRSVNARGFGSTAGSPSDVEPKRRENDEGIRE